MIAAFEALARDGRLRAAALTGAGDKSFIPSADLAEMKDLDAAVEMRHRAAAARVPSIAARASRTSATRARNRVQPCGRRELPPKMA